jgi:CO/xanthine dehydrogenase FAD-binding subunit
MAPVLIAMDAKIKLAGPVGERTLPLKRLYTQNGKKPLSLRKGEILKEIFLPSPSRNTLYLKWRLRGSLDFPIVSIALHLEKNGEGGIDRAKIVFSGVGPGPVEVSEAEKMLKEASLDDQTIEEVSNQAVKEISPMRTSTVSPAYKRKIARILLKQAMDQLRNAE